LLNDTAPQYFRRPQSHQPDEVPGNRTPGLISLLSRNAAGDSGISPQQFRELPCLFASFVLTSPQNFDINRPVC
jgi:hypothetical protein